MCSRPSSTPSNPDGAGGSLPPTPHPGPGAYFKEPDEERDSTHGVHEAAVVAQQGSPAASHPQIELLRLVVVAVVCRVVGELVLDAGPRRAGIAAAEGDAVHQVPPIHVTLDATAGETDSLRGFSDFSPGASSSHPRPTLFIHPFIRSLNTSCAPAMCQPLF